MNGLPPLSTLPTLVKFSEALTGGSPFMSPPYRLAPCRRGGCGSRIAGRREGIWMVIFGVYMPPLRNTAYPFPFLIGRCT